MSYTESVAEAYNLPLVVLPFGFLHRITCTPRKILLHPLTKYAQGALPTHDPSGEKEIFFADGSGIEKNSASRTLILRSPVCYSRPYPMSRGVCTQRLIIGVAHDQCLL